MSSNETAAYKIMRMLGVDYVLVIFGGVIGYSGDDINKFLWMVRIAEGEHPKDIRVSDFWLIWFINQRALYNHALSVMRHRHHWCWRHHHRCWHLCTPLLATGLDIQTSYLVHICTYAPHICTSNI